MKQSVSRWGNEFEIWGFLSAISSAVGGALVFPSFCFVAVQSSLTSGRIRSRSQTAAERWLVGLERVEAHLVKLKE